MKAVVLALRSFQMNALRRHNPKVALAFEEPEIQQSGEESPGSKSWVLTPIDERAAGLVSKSNALRFHKMGSRRNASKFIADLPWLILAALRRHLCAMRSSSPDP
jgi:hypothetical protein